MNESKIPVANDTLSFKELRCKEEAAEDAVYDSDETPLHISGSCLDLATEIVHQEGGSCVGSSGDSSDPKNSIGGKQITGADAAVVVPKPGNGGRDAVREEVNPETLEELYRATRQFYDTVAVENSVMPVECDPEPQLKRQKRSPDDPEYPRPSHDSLRLEKKLLNDMKENQVPTVLSPTGTITFRMALGVTSMPR